MAQRRKFSEEFKREAIGLTRLPGANVAHWLSTAKPRLSSLSGQLLWLVFQ